MLEKTVIVTGANGNLGQAVVKKFSDKSYHVIGTVRHKQQSNQTNEKNAEEAELDLLQEEDCRKFVEEVIAKNNQIDVAVLTAGGFTMDDIANTTTSDIYKQYQLNFETAYNIARPVFIEMMKQNSGRIFVIGSRAGLDSKNGKGVVAYSLSKSLIFRLAELMNAEAKGKNVVVSVIVPGTIDTPPNRKSMPDADFSAWVLPSEIAEVIYFYSGDEAGSLREPVIKVYNRS
ncbi:MAG: SDR family NAD(P)-dependent oxidoreductase [Bacteroidota bacterium]|nr:SDR family NAD(P)-dependent oxidoreductase [Bacteroidota bacterium]